MSMLESQKISHSHYLAKNVLKMTIPCRLTATMWK